MALFALFLDIQPSLTTPSKEGKFDWTLKWRSNSLYSLEREFDRLYHHSCLWIAKSYRNIKFRFEVEEWFLVLIGVGIRSAKGWRCAIVFFSGGVFPPICWSKNSNKCWFAIRFFIQIPNKITTITKFLDNGDGTPFHFLKKQNKSNTSDVN